MNVKTLKIITLNPARVLRIADRKGSSAPGRDGDVTILKADFSVRDVYARGRSLVRDGRPVARGVFEGDDLMISLGPA
jgi:beta-aspartyl-dipeptidase (metallo-type)